jgi:hypothetical protein
MDVKNINVIICEKEILYSKIDGSGNDFMNNFYGHGLVMFSNQLSFKLFIYLFNNILIV